MFVQFILFFICLKLAFSACPDGSLEWQSNCLFFNSNETGFADAGITCQNLGGHLPSVHDAFMNAVLGQEASKYFHESSVTDFWIGANTLMSLNWTWTDNTPFDFKDWQKGEPINVTGAACAALALNDGYWSAQDCFKSKPFVCEISTVVKTTPMPVITTTKIAPTIPAFVNCSTGWIYFEPTHSCYGGFFKGATDWTTYETHCQSLGAHLPSIHSYEEEEFLNTFVLVDFRSIWIGLYTIDNGNTWKWTDNTPLDYFHDVNLGCVSGQACVILGDSNMNDPGWITAINCGEITTSICKKPIN